MQIYAAAKLALRSEHLGPALREFLAWTRAHLDPAPGAQFRISLSESGHRLAEAAVPAMPPDKRAFGAGYGHTPGVQPVIGSEFLSVIRSKPKRTFLQADFDDPTGFSAAWDVVDRIAAAATESGRGVMLFVHLTGWAVRSGDAALRVDATFSRFQHNGARMDAVSGVRFVAPSLKDPAVKTTLAHASEALAVRFGKPMSTLATPQGPPVADPALQAPSADAQLVVRAVFHEVLVRAARQIGNEDLSKVPLLFSKSRGFDKRMSDVQAGKKATVNFPSRLKRFMKEHFADYLLDAADPEQLWFRKPVAPTLDLLLMVDKVHQWGLGKTFTIWWAVDFPNTAFGGAFAGMDGTRQNIFWLFHEGWQTQVWAYTTPEELETALGGCQRLLQRILPALEEHAKRLLIPVPSALPAGVPQFGSITAREAYRHALTLAREWAPDAECESIAGSACLSVRDQEGSGVNPDGRIRAHGQWLVKFVSAARLEHCLYTVPHTGTVWWNFFDVIRSVVPHVPPTLDHDDWLDSSRIAPLAFAEVQKHLDGRHIYDLFLQLQHTNPYNRGRFVWQAHCMSQGASPGERKDIVVQFDPLTAELLGVETR